MTALTAVVLLSTGAWAIASKAEELGISKSYLSSKGNISKVTAIPVVTKETILGSNIIKKTSSNGAVTDKALIAKGKSYTKAIAKAEKEEVERKVEATRVAKIAAEKAKKAEIARLAKIESDKVKKEEALAKQAELIVKQAQDAKVAQAAADKAKQEEVDRIAAERADKSKQAQIAENYRIAKAASDKAEQIKVDNLAKIAKAETDRIAKVETDRIAKEEADRLAVIEADRIEADRLENADPATLTKEELAKRDANRIAKVESARLAKEAADKVANIEAAKLAKIKADRIAAASGLKQTAIGARLAAYLNPAANISSVVNRAVALHGGDPSNTCVYFSSEAMRRIGVAVPEYICNTRQYLSYLRSHGWVSTYDITKLTPGSICFTSGYYPTHTFAFMGWVNSGNYTLAYVADNQGNTVHVRNMGATAATDAFTFFMHN